MKPEERQRANNMEKKIIQLDENGDMVEKYVKTVDGEFVTEEHGEWLEARGLSASKGD